MKGVTAMAPGPVLRTTWIDAPEAALRLGQALPADGGDLVVWDVAGSDRHWAARTEGPPAERLLPPVASAELTLATRTAREQFEQAVRRGGLLVVLLSGDTRFRLHTLQEPVPIDLLDALPTGAIRLEALGEWQGDLMPGGQPFDEFFDDVGPLLEPAWTAADDGCLVVARERGGAGRCLARYHAHGDGGILLLPALRPHAWDSAQRAALHRALGGLAIRLRREDAPALLPPWDAGQLPAELRASVDDERALREEVASLQRRLDAAAARRRQVEHAWGVCAGEPSLALRNLAQIVEPMGWQLIRITVSGCAAVFEKDEALLCCIALDRSRGEARAPADWALALHAQVNDELAVREAPALVIDVTENPWPAAERHGTPAAVLDACRRHGLRTVASQGVFDAWRAGALDEHMKTWARTA